MEIFSNKIYKSILFSTFFFLTTLIGCSTSETNISNNKEKVEELNENWAYEYLSIEQIREMTELDGSGIRVALLDTGVSEFINVTEGINILNEGSYLDDHGHGTHLAGILTSEEFGVSPRIQLYVAKVLDEQMRGNISDIIEGIKWAIDQDVDIILLPFGTKTNDENLYNVISEAYKNDIFIVSSVGNYGLQEGVEVLYPAQYEEVIGVGALNYFGELWEGTTVGEGLNFIMPGQFIRSNGLNGDYIISSGTSMASAFMTGVLSLYLQKQYENGYTEGNVSYFFDKTDISGNFDFQELDFSKLLVD